MNFKYEPIDLGYDDLVAETGENGRKYVDPEGNWYPSITTVLSILSRDFIEEWKKRVGEEEANAISYRAATRGTAIHEMAEQYLLNNPDYKEGRLPSDLFSFNTIKPILDSRVGRIYAQECPLYSKHLGVAGRVDCVAEFDGKLSIIDFKTSKKPKKAEWIHNYFIQEAAYAIMWEERTGMPITQLVTVMTVDHDSPMVFIEHRDNWVNKLLGTIKQYKQENALE